MSAGFFSIKELESTSRPDGKVRNCTMCGKFKKVSTPQMPPWGNFRKGILNIGEAPSMFDDERGQPFTDRNGRRLKQAYENLGIDIFEDCLNINACWCAMDEFPNNEDVMNCRKRTMDVIAKYKPKIIMLFGRGAAFSVIGHRWKKDFDDINKWRGWIIPDQDLKAWVCPMFHPFFCVKDEKGDINTIFNQDMERAMKKLETPFPVNRIPRINFLNENELSILDKITPDVCEFAAFDYETTGLKPYAAGHRIVSASVAISPDNVFVFLMPRRRDKQEPWLKFIRSDIGKIAHNMKFEDTWTEIRLKTSVNNWRFDTMQCTHVQDNRRGVTGLKFQTYVQFGVVDYDSDVHPYLISNDEDDGNAFNRIDELLALPGGAEKLLTYNAWDSIWEYRLAMMQMNDLDLLLPF